MDMFGKNLAQEGVNVGTNVLMKVLQKYLGGSGKPQPMKQAYQVPQPNQVPQEDDKNKYS